MAHGRIHGREYSQSTLSFPTYASVSDWAVKDIYRAEGGYAAQVLSEDTKDTLTRVYGAVHPNFTDRLKGVFGASAIWLRSSGTSYDVDQTRRNSALSPYTGAELGRRQWGHGGRVYPYRPCQRHGLADRHQPDQGDGDDALHHGRCDLDEKAPRADQPQDPPRQRAK